ncbi:MAG TPA: metallophosphoesterase family protein [Thermomicrobiaceae bacterium]|nr:metallophosphoesterase family protein [Thermomicrobiaceae bacterium]
MQVAVISDVHGNLPALEAVLAELDATGPFDEIVMAGDFASGGPFPAECIERIRERGYRAVRGNTEEFLVEMATGGARPAHAVEAHQRHGPALLAIDRWVVDRLSPEQIEYLASLPLQVDVPDTRGEALAVVHATPWSTHPEIHQDAPLELARQVVDAAGTLVLAYGHIHVQYQRRLNGGWIAAVGSVGLPVDGDQRAAYAVVSSAVDGWSIEFRRVAYDVEQAIDATLRSGVPNAEGFAGTLRSARLAGR